MIRARSTPYLGCTDAISTGISYSDGHAPKIVIACADLDAQLVLSTGKWEDETGFDPRRLTDLPGNALVMEFVPQLAMLEKADLLITHAGQNTVVEALV